MAGITMNSQQPGGAFAGYQYAEDASGKVTYMSPAQLQAKETGWGIRQGDAATGAAEFTLQREKEKWDLEKKSAAATQKLTEQFLSQWGVGMDTIKGIYEGILGTGGTTKEGAGGAFGGLNDLVSKITGEYDEFKKTYSSLEEAGIESAREDLGMRREALGNLQDLSKADYKGVAGRAMTDVAVQSNAAREAEARNAMSLGIDPSSGKFGALNKRSFLSEAANRAQAANLARRGEKERVTGANTALANAANPAVGANIATGIRQQGTGMLTTAAGLKQAGAQTAADIAGSFSRDVVQPYGDVGFTLLGKSLGSGMMGTGITDPTKTLKY